MSCTTSTSTVAPSTKFQPGEVCSALQATVRTSSWLCAFPRSTHRSTGLSVAAPCSRLLMFRWRLFFLPFFAKTNEECLLVKFAHYIEWSELHQQTVTTSKTRVSISVSKYFNGENKSVFKKYRNVLRLIILFWTASTSTKKVYLNVAQYSRNIQCFRALVNDVYPMNWPCCWKMTDCIPSSMANEITEYLKSSIDN